MAKDDKLVEKDNKMLTQYILPDGTTIDIGVEKFRAPEILFAPEKIGLEYPRKWYCLWEYFLIRNSNSWAFGEYSKEMRYGFEKEIV